MDASNELLNYGLIGIDIGGTLAKIAFTLPLEYNQDIDLLNDTICSIHNYTITKI